MLTNILATLIVAVTTNTYAPKQHLTTRYFPTYPMQIEDVWEDGPLPFYDPSRSLLDARPRERDNPDVRITEVREIKTLSFEFEGRTWTAEISNVVLSTTRKKRVVTTDERWTDE